MKIKLYKDMPQNDENILLGISHKIPAIVVPDGKNTDETYIKMTNEEYNAYLISIKPELDEWKQIQKNIEYN